jgi:uncharacterized protein
MCETINIEKERSSMKCPIDNSDLLMTERNGIEIDYWPACRGIWLGRGKLDTLIERTLAQQGMSQTRYGYRHDDDDDDDQYQRRNPKRRRGSYLDNFFDS